MVAILDPDAIPAVRMSVDEYLQADLPEGARYELIDGVVQVSPTPGPFHSWITSRIYSYLSAYKDAHAGSIAHVSFESTVPIRGLKRVREPDIAVYTTWDPRRRDFQVWKEYTPVLVIEVVSPDQSKRDYDEKAADYLRTDVQEYWIVDPQQEQVSQLSRDQTMWRQDVIRPGSALESRVLPGLTLQIAELFSES